MICRGLRLGRMLWVALRILTVDDCYDLIARCFIADFVGRSCVVVVCDLVRGF